jgi:hypothetical protein
MVTDVMSPSGIHPFLDPREASHCPAGEDVVEFPLLLPSWQVDALESVAHQQGLTAAEMLRRVLSDFLTGE